MPSMPNSPKSHAIETMKFSHSMIDKVCEGMPEDKCCFQHHAKANHQLWTLGHLAATYAWLSTLLDPKANAGVPDSYNGLFGMGSKPVSDPSKYPPLSEVKRVHDKAWSAFLALVEKLDERDVWSPCASDSGGFASSKLDVAYKCAWHDGWHLGQLADTRRALGLPALFQSS